MPQIKENNIQIQYVAKVLIFFAYIVQHYNDLTKPMQQPKVEEGQVNQNLPGGRYKTFVKILGDWIMWRRKMECIWYKYIDVCICQYQVISRLLSHLSI